MMSCTLLNLTNPADLIAAVPYLLGYRPVDELVVFSMDGDTVQMVNGVDLAQADHDTVAQVVRRCVKRDSTSLVAIGYGMADAVAPVIGSVATAAAVLGIGLVDALRVTGDRYWSYTCTLAGCCPPQGTVIDVPSSPVAAHGVTSRFKTAHDTDIANRLSPVQGRDSAAMFEAIHRVMADHVDRYGQDMRRHRHYPDHGLALLDRVLTGTALPGFDDIAALGLYLRHRRVQAEAVTHIDAHDGCDSLEVWVRLTRHLPPPLQSRPASLAAYSAWRSGQTPVLAHTALAIAQRVRPDSTNVLIAVCQYLADRGISPQQAPRFADVVEMMLPE